VKAEVRSRELRQVLGALRAFAAGEAADDDHAILGALEICTLEGIQMSERGLDTDEDLVEALLGVRVLGGVLRAPTLSHRSRLTSIRFSRGTVSS
jgi:hypothetical protein